MRAVRAAFLLVAIGAPSVLACNAILGVEDVRLAKDGGGGGTGDDADVTETDADVPDTGDTIPEPKDQLALGFLHTCARAQDGTVKCWGVNDDGELGDGVPLDGGMRPLAMVPQAVVGVSDAVSVAAGISHTCVARQAGGVVCWGYNYFGQLGDGTTKNSSTPRAVQNISDAVAVAAGSSFACALTKTATMACWGANYAGQLGDGTLVDKGSATPVAQLTDVVGMAAGERHACAIVKGGTVKCWGANALGQLGNGSLTDSLAPATIAALTDVVQVVAASRFSCARQSSGQVYCWGANNYGQLGNGVATDSPNPSPLLTNVSDAIHIWTGYEHACAARRSGQVVCWGRAADGQIGAGAPEPDASVAVPTTTIGVTGALAVGTGGDHSCAATRTGSIYCWGSNSLAQCGNGSTDPTDTARKVSGYP